MKRLLFATISIMMLAGCAADGSYQGPEIWKDTPDRNEPKEIWNTNGQVQATPPKVIWRRSDGTDVIPPVDGANNPTNEAKKTDKTDK
ncbi:hypothetical protein [Hahella ganghwensis]|uniref:hypothetical protein n=1 Tax=Hahella ganghwensis TaxID=286420 RepID=UPI000377651E|nr:hypothetical protein [Hahella ganghwensis]